MKIRLKTFRERRGVAGKFYGVYARRAVGEARNSRFAQFRPRRA